jgi:hypothetical protein
MLNSPRACRFELHKRSQLFIRAHNETLSVTMRVNDEDCPRGLFAFRRLAQARFGYYSPPQQMLLIRNILAEM